MAERRERCRSLAKGSVTTRRARSAAALPAHGTELELVRLTNVIDSAGVVLVWEVDPASALRAGPVIDALEWCARHGAPVVAALPATPPRSPL